MPVNPEHFLSPKKLPLCNYSS